MTSSRSVGFSAVARAITFPVTAAATLLATALIIDYAGPSSYAAIAVVASLAQLLPFADLGIGAGVVNAVAGSPEGSYQRQRVLASAVRILIVSAAVLVSGAAIVAVTVTWPVMLGISDADLNGLGVASFVSVVLICVTVPFGLGQRVLTALMLNPLAVLLSAIVPIVSLALTAAIVWLGLAPALLATTPPAAALLGATVVALVAIRKAKFDVRNIFHADVRYPGLLSSGMWFLVISITATLTFQLGRVVLAYRQSLVVVAEYSIVMQLYLPLWSFFSVAGAALWPIFARQRADRVSGRALRIRMVLLFSGIALVAAVGLVVIGPPVVAFLSGGQVTPTLVTFVACGFLIVVQAIQLVLGVFLTSDKGLRFQAFWGIPMGVLTPVAIWLIAPQLGAAAPFVAIAILLIAFRIVPNLFRAAGEDGEIETRIQREH